MQSISFPKDKYDFLRRSHGGLRGMAQICQVTVWAVQSWVRVGRIPKYHYDKLIGAVPKQVTGISPDDASQLKAALKALALKVELDQRPIGALGALVLHAFELIEKVEGKPISESVVEVVNG